jgi:hypothetical protein
MEFVVTFAPVPRNGAVEQIKGLRRMTLTDAAALVAYAARVNYRQGRIVEVSS